MGDLSNIDIGWRSTLMLAACTPVILAALMLFARQAERAANFWLAFFLLVAVIAQIPQIIGFAGFYTVWPGLTFAPFGVELYAGPLIYLHADRLMRGGSLGWRKYLLLPGFVQTAYYVWAFLSLGNYKAKWAYSDAVHVPYVEPPETLLGLALMAFAIFSIFHLVRRYRRFLQDTQSAARDFDPVWLDRLSFALIASALVFAGLEIVPTFVQPVSYVDAFPAQLLLTAIIAWLGFEALARTHSDFPKMEDQSPLPENTSTASQDWAAAAGDLRSRVIEGEWFLEARLSLRDLAQRMSSNESYISRTLNLGLGLSFNAFINGLRVEKAKLLISDGKLPILEIAHASGFNSKATFNRVFRDAAGMTPTGFKKSQIK